MDDTDKSADKLPGFHQITESPAPAKGPRSPATMICMRGPCRHYWHFRTDTDHGNAPGTFEELGLSEPEELHNFCLVSPEGTDLQEFDVYHCNKWSPYTEAEIASMTASRQDYYRRHPEHDPSAPDVSINPSESNESNE